VNLLWKRPCRGMAAHDAPRRRLGRRLATGILVLCVGGAGWAGEADAVAARSFPLAQVFTLLFLMLGPFKIIGPFARATKGASETLTRQVAFRATVFAATALLIAAFLGETILAKYGVPVPVLSLSAGIILFLVALRTILEQFEPPAPPAGVPDEAPATNATRLAVSVAFPAIVTPYGIAALVVFLALSHGAESRLDVGAIVVAIMVLNLVVMLVTRRLLSVLAARRAPAERHCWHSSAPALPTNAR
jgi:multiple antibiotic resistance protein